MYSFAERRNRLTTHFSERIPVVKVRISVRNIMKIPTISCAINDGIPAQDYL